MILTYYDIQYSNEFEYGFHPANLHWRHLTNNVEGVRKIYVRNTNEAYKLANAFNKDRSWKYWVD